MTQLAMFFFSDYKFRDVPTQKFYVPSGYTLGDFMCLFDKSCAHILLFPDMHIPLQENAPSLNFSRITQTKFTVSDHELPWTTMNYHGCMTMNYHG